MQYYTTKHMHVAVWGQHVVSPSTRQSISVPNLKCLASPAPQMQKETRM